MQQYQKYISVDVMVILGTSDRKTKSGYPYKNRGMLMNYKFKNNSLKCIAETMKLECQKGDIDYKIFQQDTWSEIETLDIKKYLHSDVMATKQMFDELWKFWLPFTNFVDEKFIYDLSWLRNSIASLTYKSACKVFDVEPTYNDKHNKTEEMGGRVIEPKYEEATDVWYIDFASLYPHIFSMFNLFSEVNFEEYPEAWHGNEIFKVKGYYNISTWNKLSEEVAKRLEERILLKNTDKENPMIYALKIYLNALYGCARSSIFEKVHTKNCGWDCCWLGQQIQELTEKMMTSFGFEIIAGDTDSLFCRTNNNEYNKKEYVKECLNKIVQKIKDNVPFPVDTFKIDIEHYIDYIMFPFSLEPVIDIETGKNKKDKTKLVKERRAKKKNYLYIYENNNKSQIEIIGLPIKKDNATPLGMKIFKEVLEPEILKRKNAKFNKEYIDSIINDYLKNKEIMKLLAVEYKVKKFDTYKKESQIQAQISEGYFDGREGVISLIKNNKVGKAGLGTKYCTIEEALDNKLTVAELDLTKIYNELEPFIKYVEEPIKPKVLKTNKLQEKQIQKEIDETLDKETDDVLYLKRQQIIKKLNEDSVTDEDVIDWD
jgi:DNA polymerase elongation subunit (family B)